MISIFTISLLLCHGIPDFFTHPEHQNMQGKNDPEGSVVQAPRQRTDLKGTPFHSAILLTAPPSLLLLYTASPIKLYPLPVYNFRPVFGTCFPKNPTAARAQKNIPRGGLRAEPFIAKIPVMTSKISQDTHLGPHSIPPKSTVRPFSMPVQKNTGICFLFVVYCHPDDATAQHPWRSCIFFLVK